MRNHATYVNDSNVRTSKCPKDFSQRSIMLEHYKSIYEGNPFKCILCQKTFTFRKVLQNHVKLVHKQATAQLKYVCMTPVVKASTIEITSNNIPTGIKIRRGFNALLATTNATQPLS